MDSHTKATGKQDFPEQDLDKTQGTKTEKDHSAGKPAGGGKKDSIKDKKESNKPAFKEGTAPKTHASEAGKQPADMQPRLTINKQALQNLQRVAVAAAAHDTNQAHAPTNGTQTTNDARSRAAQVLQLLSEMHIPGVEYPVNMSLIDILLMDPPDLVINLDDSIDYQDGFVATVLGALELSRIPFTGPGVRAMIIGSDRNMCNQLLVAAGIPTAPCQLIFHPGGLIKPEMGLPLTVRLNESTGNWFENAPVVYETIAAAQDRVHALMELYETPVMVEKYIQGQEILVVVFEDEQERHIFMGKVSHRRAKPVKGGKRHPDRTHATGIYKPVRNKALVSKIEQYVDKAFIALHNKDYAAFQIRVEKSTGTPFLTNFIPGIALGSESQPYAAMLSQLYGISKKDLLAAMLSKYASKIINQELVQ